MNRYIPSPDEIESSNTEKENQEVAIGLAEIQKQKYHNKLLDAFTDKKRNLFFRLHGKVKYTEEMARTLFTEWLKPYEERGWIFFIDCVRSNAPVDVDPYGFFTSTVTNTFRVYFDKNHEYYVDSYCVYATTQKIYKSEKCVICHDKLSKVYYNVCGHLCICKECNETAKSECPLCRQMSDRYQYTTDKKKFSILVEDKK